MSTSHFPLFPNACLNHCLIIATDNSRTVICAIVFALKIPIPLKIPGTLKVQHLRQLKCSPTLSESACCARSVIASIVLTVSVKSYKVDFIPVWEASNLHLFFNFYQPTSGFTFSIFAVGLSCPARTLNGFFPAKRAALAPLSVPPHILTSLRHTTF